MLITFIFSVRQIGNEFRLWSVGYDIGNQSSTKGLAQGGDVFFGNVTLGPPNFESVES